MLQVTLIQSACFCAIDKHFEMKDVVSLEASTLSLLKQTKMATKAAFLSATLRIVRAYCRRKDNRLIRCHHRAIPGKTGSAPDSRLFQ